MHRRAECCVIATPLDPINQNLDAAQLDLIVVECRAAAEIGLSLTGRVIRVATVRHELRPPNRRRPDDAELDARVDTRDRAKRTSTITDLHLVIVANPSCCRVV